MADKLTPQQEMAVTSRGGKLLVSAAARFRQDQGAG